MRRLMKRFGIEVALLFAGCAVGAWIWVLVASSSNEAADAFWSANGLPPPLGAYAVPAHLMPVVILAPYAAAVAIRLVLMATEVARLEGARG
jgi:hypothetical protein